MLIRNSLIILFSLLTFCSCSVSAAPEKYVAGTHYTVLESPVATGNENKIEVVEAFWYGCPHCYSFEPRLVSWIESAPSDVEFVRFPAIFGGQMKAHAQIFLTAENLDVIEITHDPVYQALILERKNLQTEAEIGDLFESLGIEQEEFTKSFNSFSVRTKLEQALKRTQAYQLAGTPSMVVNGKYLVMAGEAVKTHEEVLQVIDFLIEKERRSLSSS